MRKREALKLVLDKFSAYRGANLTQFYAVVNRLRGGEVRIDTYACRLDNRTRKPLCKCVQRCYSNRTKIDVRDIVLGYVGGFQVDFSDLTRNCRHYSEDIYTPEANARFPVGTWDTMAYEGRRTNFLVLAPLVNGFGGTNYEHSGIEHWRDHPLHFIDCYKISRSVEFLAKSGLQQFITPTFVRRLRDDRRAFDFFRQHIRELRDLNLGIREVNAALTHRCSLAEAVERRAASAAFQASRYYSMRVPLPREIDRLELYRYCCRNRIEPIEYLRYADYLTTAAEDIRAFGATFPRDFRAALENAEHAAHLAEERREREREREAAERTAKERVERRHASKAIADMAQKLARLNGMRGYGYAVVIPKSAKMLLDEGKAMRNCIGRMGYDRKIANGESLIFFLRGMDGRKNVDVEVRILRHGKSVKLEVAQCYNPCNQAAPAEANIFARELASRAGEILFRKAA